MQKKGKFDHFKMQAGLPGFVICISEWVEKANFYENFDCAMPSPVELQSISTLEAMASGLPVVAVNAGALAELCRNGKNGFLVNVDDIDEFAKSFVKILSDEKLREKFSKESLRIAKTHDLRNVLTEFENVYREQIENFAKRTKPKK